VQADAAQPLSHALFLNDASIPSAIGGVTLGFTAKDFLTNPRKLLAIEEDGGPANWIGALLGMATGYGTGYSVGYAPKVAPPNHQQVVDLVSNEKWWVENKLYIYELILSNLRTTVDQFGTVKNKSIYDPQLTVDIKVASIDVNLGYQPKSDDLKALEKIYSLFADKFENVEIRRPPIYYLVTWFGLMVFAICVGVVVTDAVKYLRAVRTRTGKATNSPTS
jgi:hypothetical protein